MSGKKNSFSLAVDILRFLFSYTCVAVSITLNIRCLVSTDVKIIGKSVNGARRSRMVFSYALMALADFSSTKSHLFTQTIKPLRFFCMSEKMFKSCPSMPRVA